jgi:hypothetical protein
LGQASQFALHPDQFGSPLFPVFIEVIRVHQAWRIVVGTFEDRLEERLVEGHGGTC